MMRPLIYEYGRVADDGRANLGKNIVLGQYRFRKAVDLLTLGVP